MEDNGSRTGKARRGRQVRKGGIGEGESRRGRIGEAREERQGSTGRVEEGRDDKSG